MVAKTIKIKAVQSDQTLFFLNITLFLVYPMLENTLYLVYHVIIKGTEEQEDGTSNEILSEQDG